MKDFAKSIVVGNSSHTKEDAKTKDEYFKLLKFYQLQGYKTKAGEYNPDGKIKMYKGEDSVEINLVGNSKTGNDTPLEYAHRKPKVINDDKTGAEEFFKQLSDDVKEREKKDDKEIKLVGNETYQHKLYPNKYVIIEGNNYKIVTDGKVEKSGKITDAVLYGIKQTYKRVGNSTSEYEILKQDPSKMHPMYKKAYEEALKKLAREDEEFKKRFEKEYGVKAKNEAPDDKFAYVMREFDEDKLKTPDGKVVTDPAQAKAIAYSESKKTENGLARARNAMNKKNPDGLRLKIQDYAGQGLSYQDIVNQLIRFGYDKSDIEAQKEYIKSLIKE